MTKDAAPLSSRLEQLNITQLENFYLVSYLKKIILLFLKLTTTFKISDSKRCAKDGDHRWPGRRSVYRYFARRRSVRRFIFKITKLKVRV